MENVEHDETGQFGFPSLELFQHVQEHQQLYRALSNSKGAELLVKYGQNALSQRIERHLVSQIPTGQDLSVPLPIISYYLAGALNTLIQWWLENRMPYPPERLNEIFRLLVLPGVMRVLHQPSTGSGG